MSYQALLFCPDDKTARVVTQVLTELDFTVEACAEPFAAVKKLMAQHFDAIVVDCENEQNATLLFKSARNSGSNQTSLSVAVVEGQIGVAKAFRIGANLVLTKPINVEQSKGTLRVARGLLRKADSAKPAGAASPSTEQFARPAAASLSPARPVTPGPKPARTSLPAQPAAPPSTIHDVPPSAVEFEKEPTPEPGPTEAALLESMADPAPAASNPPSATKPGISKEYPWQPVSKPLSEPMASALRRAAEAAGKPEVDSPAAKTKEVRPFPASMPSGQSAASAPARAKEIPQPSSITESEPEPAIKKAFERIEDAPEVQAPTFSSLDDTQDDASGAGGGRKGLVLVVIVILLATTGYFAWTRMHPARTQPVIQNQAVPTPAPAPGEITLSTNPEPQDTASANPQSQTSQIEVNEVEPTEQASSSAKPSAGKSTIVASSEAPAAKPAPVAKTPEPIVVKNEPSQSVQHKSAAQEPVQPPAPELLGVSANGSDKALSGIVNTTPVNVPRPTPQTVKVSQGVSQGLLIKKVQPAYPLQAMNMHVQGSVQLQATISKDGSISNVKSLSGDSLLARAAMDAVRQWKYKPYYLNGEPVEIQTQITVNFKLP
jgi:protein TonB